MLEAIFVFKFIFGLNAARIPGQSVFGMPLAMLHGSRSLVVPNSSKGDTKEYRVSIQWTPPHFEQKFSMERREEKRREEREGNEKQEGGSN